MLKAFSNTLSTAEGQWHFPSLPAYSLNLFKAESFVYK